eukprot:g1938.t1
MEKTKHFPLEGIRVLELAGLAPAPFAGMVLCDWGADVVRIDRVQHGLAIAQNDVFSRGKRSIALDLKSKDGKDAFLALADTADVIIEPFRPGKMEKLGLGPENIRRRNPRLIYARMTGFGQGGNPDISRMAGHDINYLALSGVLSAFREEGRRPVPPVNILGDFAGGGMMCAFGIILALFERTRRSGLGQVIDAAMVDGAAYLSSFLFAGARAGLFRNDLGGVGKNLLDGGAPFYRCYKCANGEYISVGAIEPHFFSLLLEGLKTFLQREQEKSANSEVEQLLSALSDNDIVSQLNTEKWPRLTEIFSRIFIRQTRNFWGNDIFAAGGEYSDACVVPVLNLHEACRMQHNCLRQTFQKTSSNKDAVRRVGEVNKEERPREANPDQDAIDIPSPAPKLSRTPARSTLEAFRFLQAGEHTKEVLEEWLSIDISHWINGNGVVQSENLQQSRL